MRRIFQLPEPCSALRATATVMAIVLLMLLVTGIQYIGGRCVKYLKNR